jgi:succinate dehydrogenase / fumarate reductase iron-sulfur subunit
MVSDNSTAPKSRTIKLRIKRHEAPGKPGYWDTFNVPVDPGANVISCLQWIAANPTNSEGKKVNPVVWDCNCLEEICGACTMRINGSVRQACSCLIDETAPRDGDVIVLEPMSKFPVVRDLWVDRARIFNDLIRVKAWVPIDGTYDLGPGPSDRPENQSMRYALSQCMTCGCCMEACPQYQLGNNFIGAAPIGQAHLFNAHGTGEVLKKDRLDLLFGPGGIDDCGNAQNCVKVCPKELPLTEAIASVGRANTVHAFKKFFKGR